MTPAPRIHATQAITSFDDISDEWKIAAFTECGWDGTIYWAWPIRGGEFLPLRNAIHGTIPTLSAVQGRQVWNGVERWVLYARRVPAGVR